MTGKEHWQRGMGYFERSMSSSSTLRGVKYQEKRKTQLKRSRAQEGRISRQKEAALERRRAAIKRGEAITGIDKVERKKLATQHRWDGKWARRKMKLDARRGGEK